MSRGGRLASSGRFDGLAAEVANTLFPLSHGGVLNTTSTSSITQGASTVSSISSLDPRSNKDRATLLLCEQLSCGSCLAFSLDTAAHDLCYTPVTSNGPFRFQSVSISQTSNSGLPFAVAVSPGGCFQWTSIPRMNECFDLPNQPFKEFALLTVG